jgi:hypothetical protein
MTRAKGFALVGALLGSVLAAGMAQAASPATLKCISSQANTLRQAIIQARNDFKSGRAACFGPGADCANKCTSANDANCNDPSVPPTAPGAIAIGNSITACNQACGNKQKSDLNTCRDTFQASQQTPADQAALDACGATAREANLNCKLGCTAQFQDARLACSQALSACLGACASCPTATCP